ncbi:hypothetical protein NQ315_010869 [Exocentrus adspersus]|uniref:HTH CENPB-type domain-containing protein n=1 Tax=Exocentrus adspersus TaxID=1586481 RepID=A0AAV8V4P3_9CUCU|nr:hypothetical protein NQ315_010869 [Exocentrus adspersus]
MSRQMGRDSYLTKNEENLLGTWVVNMARAGFPIGKTQLLDSVQHIMVELKRENPFKNNRPGKSWYSSFLKRNKNISVRTPQNLTASRASVTKSQLNNWFSEVFDIEYQKVNADEKECLTVLMTGNAAGIVAPPMIIFKYERIPRDLALSVPSSWGIGKSESGWMTGETFFEYVTNVFHPWLVEQNIELPIILFIDGHVSHLALHTSKVCEQNGIILVALYPNATHKIQPMDVAVFRTLKAGWKEDILVNGFRKCGLVPWNPNAIEFRSIDDKDRSVEKMRRLKELQDENLGPENAKEENVEDRRHNDNIQETENFENRLVRSQSQNSEEENRNDINEKTNDSNNENREHQQLDVQEITSINSENTVENHDQRTPIKEPENVSQKNNQQSVEIIPSPFKKFLFYPDPKNYKKKKTVKEKIPSVVTSKQGQKRKIKESEQKNENRKKKCWQKRRSRNNWKRKKEAAKEKIYRLYIDISESEEEWEESGSSIDDISFMEDIQENLKENDEHPEVPNDRINRDINNYEGKKRDHTYVGVIQELLADNEAEVVGLKQCSDSKQFQLNENDVCTIKINQILKKLQFPKMVLSGDRLKYQFSEELNVDG